VLLAAPAGADAMGEPCNDPSRISSATGVDAYGNLTRLICAGTYWGPAPGAQVPGVHLDGTSCTPDQEGLTALGGTPTVDYLDMGSNGTWVNYRP
jgi:hypothetical protein